MALTIISKPQIITPIEQCIENLLFFYETELKIKISETYRQKIKYINKYDLLTILLIGYSYC